MSHMFHAALATLGLAVVAHAEEPDHVTMTLQQFLGMYEQAKARPTGPTAPRDATLSDVSLRGEVIRGADGTPTSAVIRGRLHVDVHATDRWVRLPVLSSEVALMSATIAGKPAPLVLDGEWYTLVTNRPGPVDLDVQFAAHVATEAGASSFSFPLAPAGASTAFLDIPTTEPVEIVVAGARMQRETVKPDRVTVEASVPSSARMSVRWQRAARDTAVAQEARVYSEVHSLVSVGDGLVRSTATIDHTILFAGVDSFKYDIPDGATVLDVRASGLRDWTVSGEGVLTVHLNYAAEAATTVAMDLEQILGEGSRTVQAPLVTPLGVERSKGWIGVTASGNLEVAAGEVVDASPVDVRTLPGRILGITNQPVLLGYKYLGTTAKIPLVVTAHDEVDVLVTLLDQASATTMFTVDGRRLTQVQWQVRNNRRQYLRLGLPEGAQLWSAAVAGRAVQPAKSGDGAVLVPLIRSSSSGGTLTSFVVEVVYVETMDAPSSSGAGHFEAQLPRTDVPTTYVSWTIYAPDGAKVDGKHAVGNVRFVPYLSQPLGAMQAMVVDNSVAQTAYDSNAQVDAGALGTGAAPVRVALPLEGVAVQFEKLLALDEKLWVGFDYRGVK